MQRWTALGCLVMTLWVAGLADAPRRAIAATTYTVAIDGVAFAPATLTVKVGETVVWVNRDPFPHTVTSQAGGFDSHDIAPGQSWRYTPTKAGVFPYLCTLHPTMHATLTVE
jgi:plastocyanin